MQLSNTMAVIGDTIRRIRFDIVHDLKKERERKEEEKEEKEGEVPRELTLIMMPSNALRVRQAHTGTSYVTLCGARRARSHKKCYSNESGMHYGGTSAARMNEYDAAGCSDGSGAFAANHSRFENRGQDVIQQIKWDST